jgi:hypothetical protein
MHGPFELSAAFNHSDAAVCGAYEAGHGGVLIDETRYIYLLEIFVSQCLC